MDAQNERPSKRFKHQSYRESLKSVHLPSATARSALDDDIPDTECHFKHALDHWRQLDLSSCFIKFADQVYPLSSNVPLLLHHSKDIIACWLQACIEASGDTLRTLFDLLQKLLHDLRDTLQPYYTALLNALLRSLCQHPSPDVLSTLLTTLLSLFKHLLKTTMPDIEETWHSCAAALVKCNPDIQRAALEAWASVIRRLNGDIRKQVLQIMLHHLPTLRDGITWCFVYALQSVAGSLHTCTSSFFEDLLSLYLSDKDRTHSEVLLRRLTTSLTHHCDNPDKYSSFADVLIAKYLSCNPEDQQPLMIVLAVMFSVRKGSRLTQKQISSVLLHAIRQPQLPSEHFLEIITLGAACLMAGDMTVWMGPGRKFIEYSWEHSHFGLKLTELLSDLDWGGWNLIELPFTSTYCLRLIEAQPVPVLSLLANLVEAGRYNHFSENITIQLSTHIINRLGKWKLPDGSIEEIARILPICSMHPSTRYELERIASEALDFILGTSDITDSDLANIFGGCLNVLGKVSKFEPMESSKITEWCIGALKRWSSSHSVLQGLIAISEPQKNISFIPLEEVYALLQDNILSHNRSLRFDSLKFLNSSIINKGRASETLNQCLIGESAPLDIAGVRERLVRINGLPRILKADDEISVDIVIKWLIAQFKVNLRPIWNPAVKVLVEVAQRCGDQVWKLIFFQLEGLVSGTIVDTKSQVDSSGHHEEMGELERSWKDPSASKLATVVGSCMNLKHKFPILDNKERLDSTNFESRLLETLGEASSLTERHNADIIHLFLTFGSPQLPVKPPHSKLKSWVTLFSKLDNPKAFYRTDTLRSLYNNLLSYPDREFQILGLTCVLNYKSPSLLSYAEHLHAFLDDNRLREELVAFDPDNVKDTHRKEFFDVLVRLFFGLMLDRHGRSGFNRRAALLDAIGRFRNEEIEVLICLMLKPFSADISLNSDGRQEIGFLNLLRDLLKRLGSHVTTHWPTLISTTIQIVANAQNKVTASQTPLERGVEYSQDEEADIEDLSEKQPETRIYRNIRVLGVRCFTDFFRCNVQYDFTPFLPSAFDAIVQPRLTLFEQENIQSSSAIMELFFIWSSRKEFVSFLANYEERVLPKIYACLLAPHVKPAVVSRVFDIIEHIVHFAEEDSGVAETVLKAHVYTLLNSLAIRLSGELFHRQISILSRVAQFVSDQVQADRLLHLFFPFLKKPADVVSEKIKMDVLTIIRSLIPFVCSATSAEIDGRKALSDQLYQVVSMLFQSLRHKSSRLTLLSVLKVMAEQQTNLDRVFKVVESLNAYSAKRIEEPDFECRLGAFTLINEQLYLELTSQEWLLILYNMLFFIQDPDERIIRNNAAFSLKRFVETLCIRGDQFFNAIFIRTLFPALKNSIHVKSELVRNEILSVLAFSVQECHNMDVLNELRPLLAQGDTEADFFNNIYHIQTHRRVRALRRLSDFVSSGSVRSTTVAEVFVPIVNHFIINASTTDHILVDAAISTLGSLARKLNWDTYNVVVRLYLKLLKDKESLKRASVRAFVSVLENFHFSMDDDVLIAEPDSLSESIETSSTLADVIEKQLDQKSKISDVVNTRLLPSLVQYLGSRNDNEDALRIPICIGIAQIVLHLPKRTKDAHITRLLTIISQVFRSKSFETRKLARDAICRVVILIGPVYLSTVITELRTALVRGSHIHILATVIHAIVDKIISSDALDAFGTFDSCATDIANVASEVIFGQSGKDLQSEGFTTTIPEVRGSSSKGVELLTLLSRHITSASLSSLLNPIKAIMCETTASKSMRLVDDVIRRISSGLSRNKHISYVEYLSLCHTLIGQNAQFLQENRPRRADTIHKNFAIQTKRQLGMDEDHYAFNKFRFVVLGLDLLNVAFRHGVLDFGDSQIISRLKTMVPVIGNGLYSRDAPVIIQSLKATMYIVKCPLKTVVDSLPAFIKRIMDLVKETSNTESEIVQTAFRTLAVIIRECPSSQISEKDILFLIGLLAPDLEEPTRQVAIFDLLRAIVHRKIVVVEIYDLMDKVNEIMVTNQNRQVQEMCRNVLLQFFLDYPQGQGRLRKQVILLTKNLSYTFESGRLSVLELLAAILTKFDTALLREYAEMFFVALVMVIANDDSSKCKELAATLIRRLFDQLDINQRKILISRLHMWCSEKSSSRLVCVSSQIYGILVENDRKNQAMDISMLLGDMNAVLNSSSTELEKYEESEKLISMELDSSWHLPYHALNTLYKCLREYPEYLTKQATILNWQVVYSHLVYPHPWVRSVASKLVGLLFNDVSPFNPNSEPYNDQRPPHIDLKEIAVNCCIQLKSDSLDANLAVQVVKNLFFIGKCFALVDHTNDSESFPKVLQDANQAEENPLPWLFSKLSFQVRSNLLARRNCTRIQDNWSEQSLAILHWFAAMSSHLPPMQLQRYLSHILNPVYRVLEDNTIHDSFMEKLKTLATELLDFVQGRVGTTKFSEVYNTIQHHVGMVRQERKMQTAIRAGKDPQSAFKRKIAINLKKKKSRARKADFFLAKKKRLANDNRLHSRRR